MGLTKRRLITVIFGVAAIVIFGLYIFLYRPLIKKLRIGYAECKAIEAEVLQARETITLLKATPARGGLISEEVVSLAINELTRQSKSIGIDFISITPKEIDKAKKAYKILPIDMEIESTYENLGIFLGALDGLERSLITVRNFNINRDEKFPEKLKTRLVINMYLKETSE